MVENPHYQELQLPYASGQNCHRAQANYSPRLLIRHPSGGGSRLYLAGSKAPPCDSSGSIPNRNSDFRFRSADGHRIIYSHANPLAHGHSNSIPLPHCYYYAIGHTDHAAHGLAGCHAYALTWSYTYAYAHTYTSLDPQAYSNPCF